MAVENDGAIGRIAFAGFQPAHADLDRIGKCQGRLVVGVVLVAQVAQKLVLARRGVQPFLAARQDLVIHGRAALTAQHPIHRGLDQVEDQRGLTTFFQLGQFLDRPLDMIEHILVGRHLDPVRRLSIQLIAIGRHELAVKIGCLRFIKRIGLRQGLRGLSAFGLC